jgi:hypothetical protein
MTLCSLVRPQRSSSVQQFEGTAAILETASPEAKLRAKEMEKIGYKGDNAIEADEVKVYTAHVRLICVHVAVIVRARRASVPRRAAAPTSAAIDFPAAALSISNNAQSSTHVRTATLTETDTCFVLRTLS